MKLLLAFTLGVLSLALGACSNLPPGEPESQMPIYGSSTPR